MRKKLTILTFFIALCTLGFGQGMRWTQIHEMDNSMSLAAVVKIGGELQASSDIELAAFKGDVCRGTVKLTHVQMPNHNIDGYFAYLSIDGAVGENFTFKLYDHKASEEYSLSNTILEFNPDNSTSPFNPFEVEFIGGAGTSQDPYLIGNLDELNTFLNSVNVGNKFDGEFIKLTADIDLATATRSTVTNWEPIGTSENPFQGTFDGNGKTIKNLNIVETEAKEGKAYIGFFGYAEDATIENVIFENVNLNIACLDIDHSQGHIGAVAGSLEGTSTIEDVTVKGDITVEATFDANGASRVAVVAGGNSYGNVTMKNVHVIANEGSYLKANNNLGALAGQLQGKSVFENCSSNIDVTGKKFFAGGIIGLAAGDQTFTNCHTTGDVTITAGREGRANDHYRVGGIAGGWADGKNNVCTLTDCSYTGEISGTNADGSVAKILDYAGYVGRGYTLTNCAGSKVVIDGVEYVQAFDDVHGLYKIDGVLTLNTADHLKNFATKVNGGNLFIGETIKLGDNIDLDNEEWTPIGNNTNKFQGYFDGNEKTISNLKISGNNKYVGLFGYILGQGMSASTTPSVKDLTLENVDVSGDHYVGGLSGQAYTCNITNVTVKGEVSGARYVGGIVGHVYTYFKDCHFIGDASCSFDALGGIAGAGDCRAYDCSVIGDVTGSNWVGGIVGNGQEGTSAVGCYVKGDVKTSNNYYRGVGGIAGVAGHGYASSEFKNNYFDGEVYLGDVKVPAMIMGLVNANDNASIKATVEGNSWNTDYYDVNTPVYVVAEISSSDASLEDWIAGTSEELTKPRNNNLVMLESDIQYVEATDIDDVTIMKFSEVTVDDILPQIEENNQVAYIDSNADGAYTEGETKYTSFEEALNAAQENAIITLLKDIKIAERTVINNRTLTIDGNGKTIRQDENFDNTIAMFDINGGKVTIKNVTFDGVKKGAAVRTVGTEFAMDNVTAQNSEHTVGQGLFRLVGQNTITNSKFLNNNCSMVITLNYDGESNTPQLVKNCLFEGNECNSVAALYYVKGAGCTIKDSEFVENTVNCNNNGATVYLGFTENNVVIGNIFDSNNVIDASTSTRVAGAIFFGYEAEIENNVFVGNTASNANNDVLGQICTSTYYDCTIDLSGNYWGGEAPEYGKDYTIQHTASEHQGVFQLDNYYKTFTTDENGNVELGDKVNIDYVAQVGKFSYETLAEAFTVAQENETITLLIDTELSEMITIPNGKTVVLDLNGKTITGTDNTTKNFSIIDNRGNLTITDSSDPSTGKITLTATTNSGWNRYSAVIANNPGGKLTIEAGTLEHLGGTDMAYGIDNLTNGKGTYAETVINGGYIKSTYRGIRQFLNGVEAQNILTVNGGTIEGANKSIWMQDPNKNANTGTLTVGEDAALKGDVYLFVTANSTEWPVEVSIASAALKDGAQVLTANVPAGYELQQDADGNYVVNQGVAKIGEVLYETLQEAINTVENDGTIVLIRDTDQNILAGNENLKPLNKVFTIDGDNHVVTGNWRFGRDDNNTDLSEITIKNVNFKGNGISILDFYKVTISECTFNDITTGNAIYVSADEYTSSIVVENCEMNNIEGAGINFRNPVNATVKGNKINGTGNNSITFQHGTAYTEAETGEYIIENNIFQNWANEASEGRALRIATGVKPRAITIENNVMIKDNAPEEFVKVTGNTDNVSVDENYWNGANPTSSNTPAYFLAEGVQVHNYYAAYDAVSNTLSDLVTIEGAGETLEIFYTAAGEVTEQANAAYSLMFTVTDYARKEVSIKIGSKKPAQNSNINLVTPSEVQFEDLTFNVTSVADNGFNGTSFKKVTISEGVETIGNKALFFMSKLTELVLPKTLASVGEQCIGAYNPTSVPLKSIVCYAAEAPSAFEPTSNASFQTCVEQQTILIVPNAADYTVYSNANGWKFTNILGIGSTKEIAGKDDKYTLLATVTSMDPKECSIKIGQKPASNSNAELVLPEVVDYFPSVEGLDFTVTSIPNNAFSTCYNFTGDLEIPATVKTIGNSAFLQAYYNTLNVGKLTLNEGLETILNSAFTLSYFNNENLVIPTTVTTIGSHAFNATNMSDTLTVQNNIPGGFNGFAGSLFTMVVVKEGVTSIVDSSSKGVFSKMSNLKTVILPSTLEEIGAAAFSEDHDITTIITSATAQVPAIENTNAFDASVKTNATVWVVGNSYDGVLAYKANAKWNEFANIHLYGAVAQIGEVEYLTIQEAIAAATSGQTITLLADVEAADGNPVLIPEGVTLDINTHNVTANIYGTVKTSGGLWTTVTVPGFNSRKMLGNGAIYNTTDATVANSASEVKMLAGSIVLNPNPETEWWTLPNQNLSIASGASFEVPANIKFTVRENTHVVVDGTLTVNGDVYLQMGATVKAAAGLNILTDVEGYMVSYENGVYSVVQAIFTQTTQLNAGWNWFSYYVDTDLAALETALGENGVEIKSKADGFRRYDETIGWYGKLNSITSEQMYQVNTNEACSVVLEGELLDNITITLHHGWNYIGYPIGQSTSLQEALDNLTPSTNDQIKSKASGNASYDTDLKMWYGGLKTLVPGEGYMYYNSSANDVTFTYNVGTGTRGELKANVTTDGNHWIPNAGQYPNNMTMTAMVEVEGGDYEVAAFVNGECRGSARPIYIEAMDAHILFLTIHGEDVEEMTFRYYDLATGEEFDLNDRMNYSNDAIVGTLAEPYIFSRGTTGIGEASLSEVNIYPNPTTTGTEINLQATCDKVEVFNALGVKVAEYHNVDSIDAFETAGIYVIRLTNNGDVKHCRIVVK